MKIWWGCTTEIEMQDSLDWRVFESISKLSTPYQDNIGLSMFNDRYVWLYLKYYTYVFSMWSVHTTLTSQYPCLWHYDYLKNKTDLHATHRLFLRFIPNFVRKKKKKRANLYQLYIKQNCGDQWHQRGKNNSILVSTRERNCLPKSLYSVWNRPYYFLNLSFAYIYSLGDLLWEKIIEPLNNYIYIVSMPY